MIVIARIISDGGVPCICIEIKELKEKKYRDVFTARRAHRGRTRRAVVRGAAAPQTAVSETGARFLSGGVRSPVVVFWTMGHDAAKGLLGYWPIFLTPVVYTGCTIFFLRVQRAQRSTACLRFYFIFYLTSRLTPAVH